MNEAELGGRTIFPNLRMGVDPIKGSAVVWYNLKKNGQYDVRLEHGGCPILLGNKWGKY
ncbi:hypothetical protein SK128_012416, partial [Halocaridina rubra]